VNLMRTVYRAVLGCDVAGHSPDRGHVRHDKGDFRTSCKRCGVALVRYGPDDWRPEDDD
jgi:hypothetical protein